MQRRACRPASGSARTKSSLAKCDSRIRGDPAVRSRYAASQQHSRSTARLRLRPLRPDDLDALIKVEGDPATNQHRPAGPPTDDEVVAA